MAKRKLPRRELPYLSTLLDKMPFSKLPTNGIVLRRLMCELEQQNGGTSLSTAAVTVKTELVELWEYAGYGDILQQNGYIVRQITSLHDGYKKLNKIPQSRRGTESFKKKEAEFTKSLELLFDITVKSLHGSGLITPEDRTFLLHHWDKTISSTRDPDQCSDSSPNVSVDSGEEFTPKRTCTPRTGGTTLEIPYDILKRLGPAADRLNLSNNVLTTVVAAVTNHGGGDIDELSLSKSTARRHRISARSEKAASIKKNFNCSVGQINLDGKLLSDLGGFGKVNRLAVVLVQEQDNKILCISKTENATGRTEAEMVKQTLDDWKIAEKIIASGFDTTSSNTGVHKGAITILQELLDRQLLWLACRHHILELVVGAAFTELFGETKSPEVTLFKILKTSWDSLDLSDIVLPVIPASYLREKEELLSFINTLLQLKA